MVEWYWLIVVALVSPFAFAGAGVIWLAVQDPPAQEFDQPHLAGAAPSEPMEGRSW